MRRSGDITRVLIVDDDPILRMLACEALGDDFEVIEAGSGTHALREFADSTPDLVLLDLVMPDVDGFEVCRELRATAAGASTPILMMTGLDDPESIERAYQAGATDFVTKPINYALLSHRLRYLMRAATAFADARQGAARLVRAQRLAHLAQWQLDIQARLLQWSDEALSIYGIPVGATDVTTALLRWVHAEDRDAVAGAIESGPHTIDYRVVLPDGRTRFVHQEAELVVDAEGGRTTLEGAVQDITELRDAERQVHALAYYDSLTGLPNRAFLRSFLGKAIDVASQRNGNVAALALDLDGFKRVNDTLGHAGGDDLLREVAKRIMSCVRRTDSLACTVAGSVRTSPDAEVVAARLGGDEFVIVLRDLRAPEDAGLVAQRIADRLSSSFHVAGTDVFISSSIGIATFPADAGDVDALLDRADVAMYHAKHAGRNRVQFFAPVMKDETRARLELEQSFRAGLARAGIVGHAENATEPATAEFHLAYQPKIEFPSGDVVGVEALLRWASPDRGPMSPADFIPIAEESGLIVPLGAWVLYTACRQAKKWATEGERRLRVAVNVSARQFREPGFAGLVAAALAETQLDPSLLELEITEGMIMEDTNASKRLLAELKALGVRIALDDFGTGYSSLSYLTRLPIDALKIDRSFVRELDTEGRGQTITAAIIALSRSLGIDVVVEGVETAGQLAFVNRQGPTEVQGFYFAKPMPPASLIPWREEFETQSRKARPIAA